MASVGAVRGEPKPVKLSSWPKVIFFYPTLLAALLAGFASEVWDDRASTWGTAFLIVFFVNLVVVSFDFPRTASLNLLLGVVAVVLAAVLINQRWTFLPFLEDLTGGIAPAANNQFYWYFAGSLALVYLVVLILDFRFNYWLIRPNEIIHRQGIFGNVSRYPAPGLEFHKEITDVFEYIPFRFGRIVIQPARGPAIVLENVFRVDDKEREMQRLLDALNVEISERERITENP